MEDEIFEPHANSGSEEHALATATITELTLGELLQISGGVRACGLVHVDR